MARYIGTITSDARGKVGGLVMTRASNGTNLKAHAVPVNVRSQYQATNRQRLSAAVTAWRKLSDPQRVTWSLIAYQYTYLNSLAQAYSPTGLQLWTQAFINAATVGATPPAMAPTVLPSVPPVYSLFFHSSSFGVYFNGIDSIGDPPLAWNVSVSSVLRSTINYTTGIRRRPMGGVVGSPTINCTAEWEAAYGAIPVVNATVSARALAFDNVSYISGTPSLFKLSVLL
jgi:hypothetical protein